MDATSFGATASSGRRRFLQAVGLAGVAATLPVAAGSAAAQDATTTTAPPRRPTDDDVTMLGFAESVELAAVAAYDTALGRVTAGTLTLEASPAQVAQVMREHHVAYAQAIAGLLGRKSPGVTNAAVIKKFGEPFASGAAADVIKAAADLEGIATATHGSVLGQLTGIDGASLIASIMAMEARHSSTLTALGGGDAFPSTALEALDSALSPDDYPVQ